MTVVDTSALLAVLLGEPGADACADVLAGAGELCISAGTLAEALIVAGRRGVLDELARLVDGVGIEVVALDAPGANRVARAYERWGKGLDPAGLNLGDCFAYELAAERGAPLLFVGDDFRRTDVAAALP